VTPPDEIVADMPVSVAPLRSWDLIVREPEAGALEVVVVEDVEVDVIVEVDVTVEVVVVVEVVEGLTVLSAATSLE
jgi:hypothetical protein